MTARRDPDTIVAAWLDEGPTTLPAPTRRAILTALPVTRRAGGRRWGFDRVGGTSSLLPAFAAVIAAIALVVGLSFLTRSEVGPPANPPTSPSVVPTLSADTSTWAPFRSERHGIAYRIPPSWKVSAASSPWIWQPSDPGPSADATDRAVGPEDQAFVVASQRLPDGMTEDAWWADYLSADTTGMPTGCFPKTRAEYEPIQISGHRGFLHGGEARCNFTEAIVIVGGRAYQLTAYADVAIPSGGVFDRAVFDAWLSTVIFDPATADDNPAEAQPTAP